MGDQKLGEYFKKNSANSMTIKVQRRWVRDDEDELPEAAEWILEQCERLHAMLADPPARES